MGSKEVIFQVKQKLKLTKNKAWFWIQRLKTVSQFPDILKPWKTFSKDFIWTTIYFYYKRKLFTKNFVSKYYLPCLTSHIKVRVGDSFLPLLSFEPGPFGAVMNILTNKLTRPWPPKIPSALYLQQPKVEVS